MCSYCNMGRMVRMSTARHQARTNAVCNTRQDGVRLTLMGTVVRSCEARRPKWEDTEFPRRRNVSFWGILIDVGYKVWCVQDEVSAVLRHWPRGRHSWRLKGRPGSLKYTTDTARTRGCRLLNVAIQAEPRGRTAGGVWVAATTWH